jgi:hypothetical protein
MLVGSLPLRVASRLEAGDFCSASFNVAQRTVFDLRSSAEGKLQHKCLLKVGLNISGFPVSSKYPEDH